MKKTNLITTLALVVIVAIALSTATFAWYSANTNVFMAATNMTAAAPVDSNLTIQWGSNTASTTSVTGETVSTLKPACPTVDLIPVTDTASLANATTTAVVFNTMTVDSNSANFTGIATGEAPSTSSNLARMIQGGETSSSELKVTNDSNAANTKVSVTVTIAGENAGMCNVAVFYKGGELDGKLLGVWGDGAKYADLVAGTTTGVGTVLSKISASGTALNIKTKTSEDVADLVFDGSTSQTIQVVVWYDGFKLTGASRSADGATVKVDFNAVSVSG